MNFTRNIKVDNSRLTFDEDIAVLAVTTGSSEFAVTMRQIEALFHGVSDLELMLAMVEKRTSFIADQISVESLNEYRKTEHLKFCLSGRVINSIFKSIKMFIRPMKNTVNNE